MQVTHIVLEFGICALLDQGVCEAQSTAELLVLVRKVHGGEEG